MNREITSRVQVGKRKRPKRARKINHALHALAAFLRAAAAMKANPKLQVPY
jgi:hypothetical protein